VDHRPAEGVLIKKTSSASGRVFHTDASYRGMGPGGGWV
jgi:hypothetical protein